MNNRREFANTWGHFHMQDYWVFILLSGVILRSFTRR